MMRLIRRLFLFFCLFLTGFVIWAGVHARKNGFSESWRNAIEAEFAYRGYYVEIGKITLGAFRGLVAEDIHFFRDAEKNFEIASVDDVYLDVDLSKILNKEISINTLDVADASLSLPVDPSEPSGKTLKVENLSGRVVITESVIEIVSAEASIGNVELNLAGTLLRLPLDERSLTQEDNERNSEQLAARRYQISRVIEELERYDFLDEPAMIEVEFRGDLEDLSTMTARVEVESGQLSKKEESEYRVEGLSAIFRFDGQSREAEIESLSIRDEQGEIALTGRWDQEKNLIEFEMVSNADISSLVGFFWNDRKLGEVVFFTPPEIEMKGNLNLNELGRATWSFPGSVIGQFKSDRFVTRGTVFSGIDFGFSAEGEKAYVRNLRLDHKSGVAFANFKYEPGNGVQSIQYHTEIKLDPEAFRPFFYEGGRKFLDSWEFSENSAVYLAAVGEGENWDLKTWINKGVVDLRNFQLKGVEFREMEADFEAKSGQLWLYDIVLGRSEGEIVAEMVNFTPDKSQWEVKGVVSTVDLVKGTKAFNSKLSKYLERYRFNSHPTVKLAGFLDSKSEEEVREKPRNHQLAISFSCDDSAEYEFLGKVVPLSSPSGELEISGGRVHLTKLSAGVFDGSIELEYDALNVRSKDKPYDASVRVSRVPLEDVTRLYGGMEVATGRVDAVFHLSGRGGDVSKLNGHGAASIEDGELFALPVMGALAGFLQVSPSNGGVAREAQATFQIEDGVLQTDDFVALADNVFVRSAGTISFADQSVDLEAVVNPKGALSRTILTPVSELLTFSCSGTLHEPVWTAKHISNIGKLPSQVINEMTQVPFEGLKAIRGGLFKPQAKENYEGSDGDASSIMSPNEGLRSIGKGIFGPQKKRIERTGAESVQERPAILPGLRGIQSQKSQD